MKRRTLCILCTALISLSLSAQRNIVDLLQSEVSGSGRIVIHQDESLTRLIGVFAEKKGKRIRAMGYRVQVYMGNNSRNARTEAEEAETFIRSRFPNMTVYVQFFSPRWVCRVGDFRSAEEAHAAMRALKEAQRFKEISVVRVAVNLPE